MINNAEKAYRNELRRLKTSPTNADLKQNTLRLGREFSRLTREFHSSEGITIYDEMALMNDINAACASASIQPKIEVKQTVEERLIKLSELKEKNLINELECNQRRQKILDEI